MFCVFHRFASKGIEPAMLDRLWLDHARVQAMAAGITLKGLTASRASLEEAFFAITGGEPSDPPDQPPPGSG